MNLTPREFWTVLHGMVLGAAFLLAFSGGLAGLYSLRAELLTPHGIEERLRRLRPGMWLMALLAWVAVLSGTYIVYVWYRANPPAGAADLTAYPRALLLSRPGLKVWHAFGMEWKEHVAWIVPFAATSVAAIVQRYGRALARMPGVRRAALAMLLLAFGAAGAAGLFGAFINKMAALR